MENAVQVRMLKRLVYADCIEQRFLYPNKLALMQPDHCELALYSRRIRVITKMKSTDPTCFFQEPLCP
jgi:ADP-glucose pyrophosphorylase